MPWRSGAVATVERDCLRVAGVLGVVAASVTQIDTALEGDVVVRSGAVPKHDQLLVVAASAPHALVENDLATGLVDHLGEGCVALLGEMCLTRVRSPQQPTYLRAASGGVGKDATDLGARSGEELVAVALPIGEVHAIASLE